MLGKVPHPWLLTDTAFVVGLSMAAVKVVMPGIDLDQIQTHPDILLTTRIPVAVCVVIFLYWLWFSKVQNPYRFVRPWEAPRMNRGQKPNEFPPPFPNGWFALCPSDELKKGEVKKYDVLGQHLVLFRNYEGKAAVLEAWCPHLGAHLGVGGTVSRNSNCLRCPFHGWEFDTDGKCVFVEGTDVIPTDSNIRAFPTSETNQLIFFWHDAEGGEPTWNVRPRDVVEEKRWYSVGRTYTQVNAHIQEIPENGPDSAHLNVLHKDFVWDYIAPSVTHKWAADWAPHPENKHMSKIELHQSFRIFGYKIPHSDVHASIEQHGPGLVELRMQMPIGAVVSYECVTPLHPTQQQVYHTMHASPGIPRWLGKIMLWAMEAQFSRDIEIWCNKKYLPRPKVSKADGPILAFRRWYKQFYSAASVSFPDAVAKENMLDW